MQQFQYEIDDTAIKDDLDYIFCQIMVKVLVDDNQINQQIEACLSKLNQNNKLVVVQFIISQFKKYSFVQTGNYLLNDEAKQQQNDQADYQKEYLQCLKDRNHEKIHELIKNQKFWEQCPSIYILSLKQNLLRKMGPKILDLLDLFEACRYPLSQFEIFKKLLGFAFYTEQQLTNEQITEIQQIIGSQLQRQIYEFQDYVESIKQKHIEKFENFITILKNQQMQIQQHLMIHQEYQALFELFSQDLTKSQGNLNNYFMKNAQLNEKQLYSETIIQQLEYNPRLQFNFNQFYFQLIIYFWCQYCEKFNLTSEVTQLYKNISKLTLQQERKMLFEFFCKKYYNNKSTDSILKYLIGNFVYYSFEFNHAELQSYEQFKKKQTETQIEAQKYPIIHIFNQNYFQYEEFFKFQKLLQQICYHRVSELMKKHQNFNQLIFTSWKNLINVQNYILLSEIFLVNTENLLEVTLKLEAKLSKDQRPLIMDVLSIISQQNQIKNAYDFILFNKLLLEYSSFKNLDQNLLNKMLESHNLLEVQNLEKLVKNCTFVFENDKKLYNIWLEPFEYFKIYEITPEVVEKDKLIYYLKESFLKHFKQFVMKPFQQKNIIEIHNYFGFLKQFGISFNETDFQELTEEISSKRPFSESRFIDIYNRLKSSWQFNEKSIIRIKNKNQDPFLKNQHKQYISQNLYEEIQFKTKKKQEIKENKVFLEKKYFFFNQSKIKQCQQQFSELEIFMQFIISPQNNQQYSSQFKESFPQKVKEIMRKLNRWQIIYFEIYEYIKKEILNDQKKKIVAKKVNRNFSDLDQNIAIYSLNQIEIIMKAIQEIMKVYNNQFALFGIMFTGVGERCIYYYSLLIIWRFICYKKCNIFENRKKRIGVIKTSEFNKFQTEIMQNKYQQSILKAQIFVESLQQSLLEQYYQQNQKKAKNFISHQSISSFELIKQLDKKLLINQNSNYDETLQYIQDQKSFIEQYAKDKIQEISQQLVIQHEEQLRQFIKSTLLLVCQNAQILSKRNTDQIKSKDFFKETPQKGEGFYENILYQIVISCLQGEESQYLNAVEEMFRIFFQKSYYKPSKFQLSSTRDDKSNQQIQLLKPFIEEVYKELNHRIESINQINLNIDKFRLKSDLDAIRLNMIGCNEICPICKRKCDEGIQTIRKIESHYDKHQCKNGHLIRGMNKVMINNKPSLFTCEEIEDGDLITIQETKQVKTWKLIQEIYNDWHFRSLEREINQQNIQKMTNIWNGNVGMRICQNLNIPFEQKSEFLRYQLLNSFTHYIFVLDNSFSMIGQNWANAQNAAQSTMQEIKKNQNARISLIIFNHEAKVAIDCEKVDVESQKKSFEWHSGGTDFSKCFDCILQQLKKWEKEKFEKTVLLFYTDGHANYPAQEIDEFLKLPKIIQSTLTFIICTETNNSYALQMIYSRVFPHFQLVELKTNLQTNSISYFWAEIIEQNYHKLRI